MVIILMWADEILYINRQTNALFLIWTKWTHSVYINSSSEKLGIKKIVAISLVPCHVKNQEPAIECS